MDHLDRALLEAIQEEFPVSSYPYEVIAARCDTSAEEAEQRIARMRTEGTIRRLGAVLDSRALGMVTTLAAADVEPDAVDQVASHIDRFPEVTHSYLREGRPNLWFTLVAASQETIDEILGEVRSFPGVLSVAEFPATRLFKLGVRLSAPSERKPE